MEFLLTRDPGLVSGRVSPAGEVHVYSLCANSDMQQERIAVRKGRQGDGSTVAVNTLRNTRITQDITRQE
jgi:ferredoxin-NADP reductase